MKRNVDLSESRIFTTPEPPTGIAKLLLNALKVTKPWDFENNPRKFSDDVDFEIEIRRRPPIFAVGDKKQRKRWKRNRAYYANEICDCCGQSRGRKPWAKKECNCYSMSYNPRIPWKFLVF